MKGLIDRIRGSLTVHIFFITSIILVAACAVTYGFIALATPISYSSIKTDELDQKGLALAASLEQVALSDAGPLLADFEAETGARVFIHDKNNNIVNFPAPSDASQENGGVADMEATIESNLIFTFVNEGELYTLLINPRLEAVNHASQALMRVLPYLILVILAVSLLGAFVYSRIITKPIVSLSTISQKMADLDFSRSYSGKRTDDIGLLGKNLNRLSNNLSAALTELQQANEALQADFDRERALERQRMDFFSAASHELKTPVTILKGQLSGMLTGVDIYKDRDKYIARALEVTTRMEHLIREILDISRIDNQSFAMNREIVDLSALLTAYVEQAEELAVQREIAVHTQIPPDIIVEGDGALLGKAINNLLTNALQYSPPKARVFVQLNAGVAPSLTVENEGVSIPEDSIPHLFEAFYLVNASRSQETGGSGLGLYLVKMILDSHGATYSIANTTRGVKAEVQFSTQNTN